MESVRTCGFQSIAYRYIHGLISGVRHNCGGKGHNNGSNDEVITDFYVSSVFETAMHTRSQFLHGVRLCKNRLKYSMDLPNLG